MRAAAAVLVTAFAGAAPAAAATGTAPAPASTPPPPVPVAAAPAADAALWGGVGLELLPKGSITLDDHSGTQITSDTATALSATGLLEYRLGRYLTIGVWPRYVLGVKVAGATSSASELDVRGRITGGVDVAQHVRVFGYGAGGYSWVFPPSMAGVSSPNETGPCVAFGAGAAYAVSPRTALAADLGYQLGFQGATGLDAHVDYLHVGVALLVALGR